MSLISFKSLKLFRLPPPSAKRKNGGNPPQKEGSESFVRKVTRSPFLYVFVFALVLSYFVSYVPSKTLPELKPGEIAPSDIVALSDLTLEDTETTEARRRDAVDAVLPVYVFEPNVLSNTAEKVRQFFKAGQDWVKEPQANKDYSRIQKVVQDKFGIELAPNDLVALERAGFPFDLESSLLDLLEKDSAQGIILSKSLFIHKEQQRGFTLVRGAEGEKTVLPQEILDVKEAKEKLVAEVNKLDIPPRRKGLLITLSFAFLAPNVSFDKVETEARQAKAKASVETVFYTIKKGKVLLRKGDEATEDIIKRIDVINQSLKTKRAWSTNFLGTFLLLALLLVTMWFYLKSLFGQQTAVKDFVMMGLTLILGILVYKVFSFLASTSSQNARFFLFTNTESYRFAFPYQFGTLLFAFLTTNAVALIFAILNGLLVGFLFGANYQLMIYSLIGGLAAIYGIKYYQRQKRTATLRAGFFVVAPMNVFVVLTLYLIQESVVALDTLSTEVFMGIVGGILSASLAFVLLPLYESVFGLITQSKLLELTNSESELFRQMAIEAPGSYHHSLIVASLAEKAAEEVKLDPLLIKAGALYHDIGKLKMPEYFIENKNKRVDVHRDLTPSMSTLVIVNHVKEGIEIARKQKLPAEIREIIEQHHGNSLVRFFYQKAKEKYDPEMQRIGEESYRYPGPPPQSKEAALVMLADSVEAASRSLKSQKEENLKRVIKDIFDNYIQDGQLDECNFSIKELKAIAASFLATLITVYQPRIEYPGFDFEMKKAKRPERNHKKENDRDSEPPEEKTD